MNIWRKIRLWDSINKSIEKRGRGGGFSWNKYQMKRNEVQLRKIVAQFLVFTWNDCFVEDFETPVKLESVSSGLRRLKQKSF